MKSEDVILVDSNDREIGSVEKLEAHRKGLLHRAFSVCIFSPNGHLLIHQRAATKYHSAGLWTNTCCSHPRPGESTAEAALRRLEEEMGFRTTIHHAFSFTYHAELDRGLVEHEFDHVFTGIWSGEPSPSQEEVSDWKWSEPNDLLTHMKLHPENYTAWFRILLPELLQLNYPMTQIA
jgi:isopentenyl-diphosphate delta-isomerase